MRAKASQLNIRVTPEQERTWKAAAGLSGKTLTDWISDLADLEALRLERRVVRESSGTEVASSRR